MFFFQLFQLKGVDTLLNNNDNGFCRPSAINQYSRTIFSKKNPNTPIEVLGRFYIVVPPKFGAKRTLLTDNQFNLNAVTRRAISCADSEAVSVMSEYNAFSKRAAL